MASLENLTLDNCYSQLPGIFFSRHQPDALKNQFLIHFNKQVADMIGLDHDQAGRQDFLDSFMCHNKALAFDPVASCYAGHQFGHYVPRLGDGRALLLGQVLNSHDQRWDLQLKGAGKTMYSRDGDGRAVLRSSIREYLCSAAMHGLGIPTTHALFLSGSTEEVYREQIEPGAMVLRVAPSHIRFGNFEYFFYSQRYQDLETLFNFTIDNYFPDLADSDNPALALLENVIAATAKLIAQWQAVGFAHGVMNSDNMSIHAITLDYGPFGFVEDYNPEYICNHSDYHGRYAFNQQPAIGLFNLSCLAQALLPLLADEPEAAAELARHALDQYDPAFQSEYRTLMFDKLGIQQATDRDWAIVASLLDILEANHTDYTIFFRTLSQCLTEKDIDKCRDLFIDRASYDQWHQVYLRMLKQENVFAKVRSEQMKQVNPKYILRNYIAETAIRKAEDDMDYSEINTLVEILSSPFDEHTDHEHYAGHPPEWARNIAVSCSS